MLPNYPPNRNAGLRANQMHLYILNPKKKKDYAHNIGMGWSHSKYWREVVHFDDLSQQNDPAQGEIL